MQLTVVHHFRIAGAIYIFVALCLLITSSLLLNKIIYREVVFDICPSLQSSLPSSPQGDIILPDRVSGQEILQRRREFEGYWGPSIWDWILRRQSQGHQVHVFVRWYPIRGSYSIPHVETDQTEGKAPSVPTTGKSVTAQPSDDFTHLNTKLGATPPTQEKPSTESTKAVPTTPPPAQASASAQTPAGVPGTTKAPAEPQAPATTGAPSTDGKSRKKRDVSTPCNQNACSFEKRNNEFEAHKGVSIAGIEIAIVQILSACMCFLADDTMGRQLFKFWALSNLIFVAGVIVFLTVSMYYQTCISNSTLGYYWVAFCIMSSVNAGSIIVLLAYLWFIVDTRLPKEDGPTLSEISLFRQFRNRSNKPKCDNLYS